MKHSIKHEKTFSCGECILDNISLWKKFKNIDNTTSDKMILLIKSLPDSLFCNWESYSNLTNILDNTYLEVKEGDNENSQS